jgi:hypothetical protein
MNKIFLIVVMVGVFVSILINSSYAQSSDNFKTYTNNDMRFSIQNPSIWQPEYSDFKPDIDYSVVYFGNIFEVGMEKVEPYLDTNTLTLKNTSLQQYVHKELNELSTIDAKIIRQYPVTVGGNPAWKIEYTLDDYYEFEIFTFANGHFYRLSYKEDQLKVPETLPLANKMVESFQVNTADEDTSNNSTFKDTSNNSTFEDYQNKNCPPMSLVLCSEPEPRCPNGYHRSPDGDCEPARD